MLQVAVPVVEVEEAIGILQMITKSPDDFQYYESRLKFLRDEEAKLQAALQEGENRGIENGRAESRAALNSTIKLLQGLLGTQPSDDRDLEARSLAELTQYIGDLQQTLRDRLA